MGELNSRSDSSIERRIITGLIFSTDYLIQIEPIIKINYLKSDESKRLANWCLFYYRKYNKAPKNEIENIYTSKLEQLNEDTAELIEEVLENIKEEYKENEIKLDPLLDTTEEYFKKRQVQLLINNAQEDLDNGDLQEALNAATSFEPVQILKSKAVTPLSSADQIRRTFEDQFTPLFSYGNTPLGNFLNRSLCKGCFVLVMAQSKGSKSFTLMDMAMRAVFSGKNVVFFQAGDMSEAQQMRRQGIYLNKKSDLSEYCNELYVPVLDCTYNQNNECPFKDNRISPFQDYTPDQIRGEAEMNNITANDLRTAVDENSNHTPCYDCVKSSKHKIYKNFKGTIWYRKRKKVNPLTWKEVYFTVKKKYWKRLQKMKLITYSNETLTPGIVQQELNLLEKGGFYADVVIFDYLDIMASDLDTKTLSPRDQENKKYQRIRALSTDKNILALGATQADAKSFNQRLLTKSNFSEDKRKFDHVTSGIGLNMMSEEKLKGVIRYNSIVEREGEGDKIINVMQRLQIGRPVLGSFY